MNILIIDSNQGIADTLKKLLEHLGHKCQTTNDGNIGKKLIQSEAFDVIVLDSNVIGVEILDVIQDMRKKKITLSNIMIFATNDKNKQEFYDLGIKHFVLKPASVKEILCTLESIESKMLTKSALD